jgi:hypothetical protein
MAKDFDDYLNWEETVTKIINDAANHKIAIVLVTADAKTAAEKFQNIPILKCDATVMKTAARVTPTIFLMEGATIKGKYSYRNFNAIENAVRNW